MRVTSSITTFCWFDFPGELRVLQVWLVMGNLGTLRRTFRTEVVPIMTLICGSSFAIGIRNDVLQRPWHTAGGLMNFSAVNDLLEYVTNSC